MSRRPPADEDRDPQRAAEAAEWDRRSQLALLGILENAQLVLAGLADLLTGHAMIVVARSEVENESATYRVVPNESRTKDGWPAEDQI